MNYKKDFKIYSYHAECPNCKNYNTRINKARKYQYWDGYLLYVLAPRIVCPVNVAGFHWAPDFRQ